MPLSSRRPVAALAVAGCPILPASSPWNQRVDHLPVHPRSAAIVRSIGLDAGFHADFGSGRWEGSRIGIPYRVVPATQRKVPVRFRWPAESDPGPYPIPRSVPVEGRSDRHVIVLQRGTCRLYELFDARRVGGGTSWRAGSGAVFDLRSGGLRPEGWTSADAAGLPIFPGLARIAEVKAGAIRHALRFTAPRTRRAFVWPARHHASPLTHRDLPAMGQRVRLKRSVSERGLGPQARVIVRAMKRYGLLLADNGSPWHVTGAPSERWDNRDLHTLDRLTGRDFEVVAEQQPPPLTP
jgi:hypothetical protein